MFLSLLISAVDWLVYWSSVELEAGLKKNPLRALNKERWTTKPRARDDANETFDVEFANVVKLSENQSPEPNE